MKVFDLHCDTVGECFKNSQSLRSNSMHFSLEAAAKYQEYCQVFAVWIADELRGQSAVDYFDSVADLFYKSVEDNSDLLSLYGEGKKTPVKAILSVEGGSASGGTLEGLRHLHSRGVKLITLTWNSDNEIGGGAFSQGCITDFGAEFIRLCEELGIIIDVSHLNKQSFWDVVSITCKPFVASHSNADIVDNFYGHKRNLDDEQIKVIRDRGGLIGINFCQDFLQQEHYEGLLSLGAQIKHLLDLGCRDVIALGSDFDGCDMIDELKGVRKMESVYHSLASQGFDTTLLDKMFFENAKRFFDEYI